MALFSWRARRQLFYIGILGAIILGVLIYAGVRLIPETTCFDNKRNQGEEGIDCGGPCKPCLENLSEPVVLWSRFFKLREGVYEAAILVENLHNFASSRRAFYRVKLYDQNNILIALREGETFINPNERFLILEPGLFVGARTPARILIEFEPIAWQYAEYTSPNVVVVSRNFSLSPQPRLNAILRNNNLFEVGNLQVAAVLLDSEGTALAASVTVVKEIGGKSEKTIFFSWPSTLQETPETVEILIRTFVP
ncbi:hypothetical protein IIA95_03125 [Patescibacteria group bacterium]|nr:hypothetical protein [Patescibacteria group bacterium]